MATQQLLSAARARLRALADESQQRKVLTNEEYYGGGRREEAIHNVSSTGSFDAIVTRNHYGCLVLNAAHTLFIDVDRVDASEMPAGRSQTRCQEPWQSMFDDLRIVLASEKNEGFRIYRTAAGFRILATTHQFEPDSHHAKQLMESAGADSAFVNLCRIQKSFRARLTPKPWRCGARRPPNFFPRKSADEKRRFAEWLAQYERAARNHATCKYLGHVGAEHTHQSIAPVIEFHDCETRALDPLPLA